MGYRLDCLAAGQRSDLTDTKPLAASVEDGGVTDPAIRAVVLALLAVDGILSALAGAMLLPSYLGSIPFPVSALISGLVNAALVWAAGRWTTSARVAALPLWTWLLTVAGVGIGGPAGNEILNGRGVMAYSGFLLIVLGVVPPLWVLSRRGEPS